MKIVGRVHDIDKLGYVTLYVDGTPIDATCDAKLLHSAGIKKGDEFQVKFSLNHKTVMLVRLPPKKISKKRAKQICDEVDRRLR